MPHSFPANGVERLDINRASEQDLETLPGIGPKTAAAVIRHREENGPFLRIEEIMLVEGIGEKQFQKIRYQIAVK
ncbi:MAG: helix-hairpin-helix domain-containing protein [Pyrinomonadaceae bacterium]